MNYTTLDQKFKRDFLDLVDRSNSIVITSHKSPDDDAIASGLATYRFVTDSFPQKSTRIIYMGEPEPKLLMFQNYSRIEFVTDLVDSIDSSDLLIVLDGSQFSRFTEKPEDLPGKFKHAICIDHHSSPVDLFTHSIVIPTATSCAELVYSIFYADKNPDPPLAEIFMLGILGDTGNFHYLKPNQTNVLEIAKRLIEISNIEIQDFQAKYRSIPQRSFRLIQELIKNTRFQRIANWPDFQTSFLSRKFVQSDNFSDKEVSQASHIYMGQFLRTVDGFPWGLVVTPKSNGDCSISGRSLPQSVSVREIMAITNVIEVFGVMILWVAATTEQPVAHSKKPIEI